MAKINVFTGHSLHVTAVTFDQLPEAIRNNDDSKGFTTYYAVKNFNDAGYAFFYLAKGLALAPRQICGFYPNGRFWSSYGTSLQTAVDGMIRDGWLHAN